MAITFCPNCMNDIDTSAQVCPRCGFRPGSVEPNQDTLPVGTVLEGKNRYILGRALGMGGFGITYVAKQLDPGKVVAIKEYFNRSCHCIRNGAEVVPQDNPLSTASTDSSGRRRCSKASRT